MPFNAYFAVLAKRVNDAGPATTDAMSGDTVNYEGAPRMLELMTAYATTGFFSTEMLEPTTAYATTGFSSTEMLGPPRGVAAIGPRCWNWQLTVLGPAVPNAATTAFGHNLISKSQDHQVL